MDVSLGYTLDREFRPGDTIQFLVHLFHQCASSALAVNVDTLVYLPSYVFLLELNNTDFMGQLPELDFTPGLKKAAMSVIKKIQLFY